MAGVPVVAVRVKRRLSALGPEPPEALLLLVACKRARGGDAGRDADADDAKGDVERSVFTFAGTVRSRDDSPESVRQALLCSQSKQHQRQRHPNTPHHHQQLKPDQQPKETDAQQHHHQPRQRRQAKEIDPLHYHHHHQPHPHRRWVGRTAAGLQKFREQKRAGWKDQRYRVVTAQREEVVPEEGCGERAGVADGEMRRLFQVFDVVLEEDEEEEQAEEARRKRSREQGRHGRPPSSAIVCNSVELIREKLVLSESGSPSKRVSYVYDLYYSEGGPASPLAGGERDPAHPLPAGGQGRDAGLGEIERVLSVQPYFYADDEEERLVAEEAEVEEVFDDEDDENAEGNWRNDYPDEGDFDEQREFFADSDLSSDSGEDGYSPGGRYCPPAGGDYSLELTSNDSD